MASEEMVSLPAKLRLLAATRPLAPAVTCGDKLLTYSELDDRSERVAKALADRGVGPADLVTLALPNSITFVEAAWAIWKLGATPQPASFRLPKAELEPLVELARSPVVVADLPYEISRPTVRSQDLVNLPRPVRPLPDRVAPILKAPTSGGSTGKPKLILSTTPAMMPAQAETLGVFEITGADVAVIPAPLHHNAGFMMMYATIAVGGHLVLTDRFDPENTLATVERERASWLYLVPTMMSRIWRLPDEVRARYDLSTLRRLWHMAAPCPAWLKEAFIGWLGAETVMELYGGTEGQARTVISGREWLARRGSVGRVVNGEMKILSEAGEELPPGEVGEIYMRTGQETAPSYRYLGATARTAPGGWESLGDMGWFDAERYLYLADRRPDMILVGGSNVYPAEVEAALEEHPAVQSCAVIGLPDYDLGETVHAIIQPSGPVGGDELSRFIQDRLVHYKRPRTYEFVGEPLRDDAGKVRRSALKAARLKRPMAEPSPAGGSPA
jgi:bile acid-coenzyme A ligase